MSDLLQKCEVCGALLDEEDLFCANCGTEAPHARQPAGEPESRESTHNFQCRGCGASMSYDASAESLRCPFCGSERLDQQGDVKVLAPRRVVPLQVGRGDAERRLREHLGRGFWRPGDLSREAQLAQIKAVYVPYWVFQAQTHTFWTADTNQTPAGARGDWCPLAGAHHGSYAGLLVGASGALTPGETSALCPFDLSAAVPPDQVDLDNATVEQFGVQRKYARPLARQGLQALETRAVEQRYVPGSARNVHVNMRIENLASEPMLLPVWMMAYRYKDRLFRFLVNGQTGQATGEKPTSTKKVILAVVVCAVALAALLLLMLACGGIVSLS